MASGCQLILTKWPQQALLLPLSLFPGANFGRRGRAVGSSPCYKGANAGAATGIVRSHQDCPRWREGRASLEHSSPGQVTSPAGHLSATRGNPHGSRSGWRDELETHTHFDRNLLISAWEFLLHSIEVILPRNKVNIQIQLTEGVHKVTFKQGEKVFCLQVKT